MYIYVDDQHLNNSQQPTVGAPPELDLHRLLMAFDWV